jgi:hypothetical protein
MAEAGTVETPLLARMAKVPAVPRFTALVGTLPPSGSLPPSGEEPEGSQADREKTRSAASEREVKVIPPP